MKRVISFTLFGSDPTYARGAIENVKLAAKHYPGWTCRFHVGDSVDRAAVAELVMARDTEVVLHTGEPEDWSALFWRFQGLDDERVDAWLFRDCDSRIGEREAAAVREWLDSGELFHVMRDHPAHNMPVLAGMWGARGEGARKLAPLVPATAEQVKFADQIWLRDVAYPVMRGSLIVHADSGARFDREHIRPFPTVRKPAGDGFEFVGQGFTAGDEPRLPQETRRVSNVEQHEWRLFPEGTIPEFTTPEWYAGREHAPHLEQAGHRDRLMHTAAQIAREAMAGHRTLVDLGAGDGGLLSLLGPAIKAWGYDLQPSNLIAAKGRGVDVRLGDVLEDEIEWGEIAVATEMLEHLIDPHAFVRKIAEHAKVLVCSSPRLETADEHYEFHTWAWDGAGYRALVENNGWKMKRHNAVHGFQVIVAVR